MKKDKPKLHLTTLINKYKQWEKLFLYEEKYLRKKLRDKADVVFKAWIRKRDSWQWCVSHGASSCKNKVEHACHWIEAGWYSHRRDEKNVHWWCATCNGYNKRDHILFYTLWIENKFWKEWVEMQQRNKNKKKPKIDDLLEIIEKYS